MAKEIKIERREFLLKTLKFGCAGAMGLSMASLLPGCDSGGSSGGGCDSSSGGGGGGCADENVITGYQPVVSSAWIPRGAQSSSYDMFKAMVEAATDFAWLGTGDRVLLKLALNSANDFPATTDPWALDCMLKILNEKGAGTCLVGDQAGIYQSNSTNACLTRTGLMDVIEANGATPVYFENGGHTAYAAANWSSRPSITNYVNQVDHIIYLPRIATHMMAQKTFSLKIAVGFLDAASRRTMHRGDVTAMYPGVNSIAAIKNKFRLSVTSAMKLMTTGGPDNGTIVEPNHGLIFASEDLLAADLMAGAFLNANRSANDDIYCHDAVQAYIEQNGNIDKLIWDSLNTNPNSSVTNDMVDSLQKL